jgi:hypothetical protein
MKVTPIKRRNQININHLFNKSWRKKSTALTTIGQNEKTPQIQLYILVVSKCMLSVFRPSFEVVKEGRI